MADRTSNGYLKVYGEAHLAKHDLDNSADEHIYKGDPVIQDISEDTDNVRRFDSGVTLATGDTFVGIAAEEAEIDASEDSEGDVEVTVYEYPTILGFPDSSFDKGDIGVDLYMSDSGTITTTSTNNLKIGKIHNVIDGIVYCQLETPRVES